MIGFSQVTSQNERIMIGQVVDSYETSHRSGYTVLVVTLGLHILALTGFQLSRQSEIPQAPVQSAAPLAVRWEVAAPAKAAAPQPPVPQAKVEPKPEPVKPKPVVKKTVEKPKPVVRKVVKTPSPVHVKKVPPVEAQPQPAAPAPAVPSKAASASNPDTDLKPTGLKTTSTQAGSQNAPVEQPRFNAAYLSNPAPEYPRQSQMMEEEGVVKLKVHVAASGMPLSVELYKSSGYSRLDQSALVTVKRWKFVPAKQGNQAIEGWVIVPIAFNLRS